MTKLKIEELFFSVIGNKINTDHGYKLYSALKAKVLDKNPGILQENNFPVDVNISRISGKHYRYSTLITNESKLKIRGPSDYLAELKKVLNEQVVSIGSTKIFIYEATVLSLLPETSLVSEMVIIKYPFWQAINSQERFLASCKKQLSALNIKQEPLLLGNTLCDSAKQKIMTVKKNSCQTTYIGYGVRIDNLSNQESIALKIQGIGGKRHMGCGWFE
jgi:CRISPR-associated protein Cas6